MASPVIAVVNDDTAFIDLMNELLSEEGYQTLLCKESDAAYEIIRKKKPDLVILDIRMGNPEAGWAILELVRLDPETTGIPAIVCSADSQFLRQKEAQLRQLKCEILEKPFDLSALLAKVRAGLGTIPSNSL